MTTITQICNRQVISTSRDSTVADASRLMRDHNVGGLVVVDSKDSVQFPVGIVTDRDLVVEIMAMELDPRDVTVGEIMEPRS